MRIVPVVDVFLMFLWEKVTSTSYSSTILIPSVIIVSLLVMGLFIFCLSPWFSLGRLYLSKNLSISSRLSILLAYALPMIYLFISKYLDAYDV